MITKNLYSIVIHPPDEIIELFGDLKNQLYNELGKYSSRNSMPHITVLEFEATDEQLKKIILKLIKITGEEKSFEAFFDKVVCSDKSRSAFALPDKESNEDFKKLLNRIRKDINMKRGSKKSAAHMSIGRKLTAKQLQISQKLFSEVKFNFLCSRIALRKFDAEKKQFEIVRIFPFLGKPGSQEQLAFEY